MVVRISQTIDIIIQEFKISDFSRETETLRFHIKIQDYKIGDFSRQTETLRFHIKIQDLKLLIFLVKLIELLLL